MKKLFVASLYLAIIFASQTTQAKNGPPGDKKPRTENASGIITVKTQEFSVDRGLFSDSGDSYDPETSCITIITPAADGVDRGRLAFFVPSGPATCAKTMRQLKVLNPGNDMDLNGIGGATNPELIDALFVCEDVFPSTEELAWTTSCLLEVRDYDDSGEFERTWKINYPVVNVSYVDTDTRQLDAASDAEIFELVAPDKGNGKKTLVPWPSKMLPFRFLVTRVR